MRLLPKITLINILSISVSILLFFVLAVFYYYFEFNISIREYYSTRHTIYKNFLSLKDASEIERVYANTIDDSLYYIILDKIDQKIVYCSNRLLLEGYSFDGQIKSQDFFPKLMRDKFSPYDNFFMESIVNRSANLVLLFFTAKQGSKSYHPINHYLIIFLILGGGSLIFTIVSIFALQSTGRNIRSLESTFKTLSKGGKISPIKVTGSDEVSLLVHQFNSMYKEMRESYSMRSRFLMGVSHDLKTPLTVIDGYINAIRDGVISPSEVPAVIDKIYDKTEILKERIYELINYMKIQTGEWYISLEKVPISPLLDKLCNQYKADGKLDGKQVVLDNQVGEGLLVQLDERLFEHVLENLIGNALKYAKAESQIEIKAYQAPSSNGEISISISNSCENSMTQEQLNLLFEPFYRVSDSRSEPGFGLGLCIVKSIIDAHGWNISVNYSENKIEFLINISVL